ncbi:hypothetical protein BDW02DRAFT_581314 [Decorospora gaudefroyi]|uniref:Ecp2 effector protein domain-containing protein n=1 Tax=Decorospora gaudefroyi TaxID=184978 RepID=A0A6A5K3P2_9PLEO|nr:hypothetical protein BDW02DRAFT_581314 [Decorospora gaudefroyi]
MLSKLSFIALLAATTFASALPADSQNSVSRRQKDWDICGHDDQEFFCTGSVLGWHNVKMENLQATGHKVILYSDGGCLDQIGEAFTDDTCYSAPTNTVISAYAIVLV